jgi:peptidoglycan L-alanyl-D-glutamate endopeptidase CwlK
MPDGDQNQVSSVQSGLIARLSAAAAVLGAFIAAGRAGSEWIHGHYQHKIELNKTEQELAINLRQSNSALAEAYLKLILSKETKEADKVMLLGALTEIDGHPLQKWARQRYQTLMAQFQELENAQKAQVAAASQEDRARNEVDQVQAEISQLNVKMRISTGDLAAGEKLQSELISKVSQLALLKGKLAEFQLKAADPGGGQAGSITRIEQTITTSTIKLAFPNTPKENIEANLPYILAAIKEFNVIDPKIIAAIFATIRAENEGFAPVSEHPSRFNTKEKPFDLYEDRHALGNTEIGDGERFKGRGYVLLTGRANYDRMSTRLGLGTLLIDNPDLANSPEISARILCASIIDKKGLSEALNKDDLVAARRAVNGGSHGLDSFVSAYKSLYASLSG